MCAVQGDQRLVIQHPFANLRKRVVARTREEALGYSKGYCAAARKAWPAHRPPQPPDELIGAMWKAAVELRDAADTVCTTLCEDDEFVKSLGPKIDAIDKISTWMSEWLKQPEGKSGG